MKLFRFKFLNIPFIFLYSKRIFFKDSCRLLNILWDFSRCFKKIKIFVHNILSNYIFMQLHSNISFSTLAEMCFSIRNYKIWNRFSSRRYYRLISLVTRKNVARKKWSCFALQEGERVAKLLGCDCADLYKNLLKPRIKVGNEFVTQGRNKDQVAYSVGAMSKAMFDRLFKWLVKKCNETLDTKQKRQHFIGVLDIAGFEIFDVSFSRAAISINI